MNHAQSNNIPIALLARQLAKDQDYRILRSVEIFFHSTPQGYQKICRSSLNPELLVLVLIGSTCRNCHELPTLKDWSTNLLERSPINLVLAYAAAHRQYPDETRDQSLQGISNNTYEYYKVKAQEWECSLENPSRFFLTDALCNKIKNINTNV